NIKKENIGLIEVMGLAILPGRLAEEMKLLEIALKNQNWKENLKNDPTLGKHFDWINEISSRRDEVIDNEVLKEEIGRTFNTVLEHAGVFKRDTLGKEAFQKFMNSL
ncbi:MAG: UDP-glucose--hexose-1-phosphate uridylyltransferase, partial [Cetobacterium sp.]